MEYTMGSQPTLTKKEEQILVQCISEVYKIHYSLSKIQLLNSVELIIQEYKRETKLNNLAQNGTKDFYEDIRKFQKESVKI